MTVDVWLDVFLHSLGCVSGIALSRVTLRSSPAETGAAVFSLGFGIAWGGFLIGDIGQLAGWNLGWVAAPIALTGGLLMMLGAHTRHQQELRKRWLEAGKPRCLPLGSRWDRSWLPAIFLLAVGASIPALLGYVQSHDISSSVLVMLVLILCVLILASVSWFLRWIGIKVDDATIGRWSRVSPSQVQEPR